MITEEIKRIMNDAFKELFIQNYLWLIVLVILMTMVIVLHVIFHSKRDKSQDEQSSREIKSLQIKVVRLENRINSLVSTAEQKVSLEQINEQIKDLKEEIKKHPISN